MKRIARFVLLSLASSILTLFLGCGPAPQIAEPTPANSPAATDSATNTAADTEPVAAGEKVKFKLDGGDEAFSLKFKADGAKVENADGSELARLKTDETKKVKIKDANEKTLGYVVTKAGYWKLENAEQTEELYVLRRQDDGDYKLETGANQLVYRIKARDYGFEIEAPEKKSLYKVKLKGEKLSLRNSSEKTVLYTKSKFLPVAIACFGFDPLSREQQAALAYAVNASGGQ